MSNADKPTLGVALFMLIALRVRDSQLNVVEDSSLLEEKTELVVAPWRWRLEQFPSRLFTRLMPVTVVGVEPSRRVLLRDGHCVMHPQLLEEMKTSFGHDSAGITVVVANG